MELAWFRRPSADDEGTLNLTYNAVDLPVIKGGAAAPAVTGLAELDFAGLLEQVGAAAGAFRGLGVRPGTTVAARLADPVRELLTLLATLRLGATFVPITDKDPTSAAAVAVLLVTDTPVSQTLADHQPPPAVIVSGIEPEDPTRDLTWEVAVAAGRTDSAGCEPVAPGTTAYFLGQAVSTIDAPSQADRIGTLLHTLLAGGPVHLEGVPA